MRIEPSSNRGSVSNSRRASGQGKTGSTFAPEGGGEARRAQSNAPAQAATGIDTILALQGVDDPLLAKRRAIKHGTSLLDTLEEVKADLLVGQVSEGRLNRLMALVGRARQSASPELEELIDDIELRARVELAKMGRYAS